VVAWEQRWLKALEGSDAAQPFVALFQADVMCTWPSVVINLRSKSTLVRPILSADIHFRPHCCQKWTLCFA
jgi:hypothetical protein